MQAEKVLANEDIVSKVGWTPSEGTTVKGLPLKTYVRGHLVAEDGKPVAEPGWGEFLPGPGLKR